MEVEVEPRTPRTRRDLRSTFQASTTVHGGRPLMKTILNGRRKENRGAAVSYTRIQVLLQSYVGGSPFPDNWGNRRWSRCLASR